MIDYSLREICKGKFKKIIDFIYDYGLIVTDVVGSWDKEWTIFCWKETDDQSRILDFTMTFDKHWDDFKPDLSQDEEEFLNIVGSLGTSIRIEGRVAEIQEGGMDGGDFYLGSSEKIDFEVWTISEMRSKLNKF